MTVVNNRETNEGDNVFYVDKEGAIHDAVVRSIYEKDGNHFAELKVNFSEDGQHFTVADAPHNTSPEKHSWNHPRSEEEVELHNHPDFYGSVA